MNDSKLLVTPTAIPDVLILEPKVFGDNRGWFTESFNAHDFAKASNLQVEFVQDNHSFSRQWTLRGLHYQIKHTQGKLVRVIAGSVFDVVVDLRKDSATFGKWVSVDELENYTKTVIDECLSVIKQTPTNNAYTTFDLDMIKGTIAKSVATVKQHFYETK